MRHPILFALILLLTGVTTAETPSAWGQSGTRYHFKNARLYVSPGRVVERGSFTIEEGKIKALGNASPAAAIVIDLEGKVVHPGFIDPYVEASRLGLEKELSGVTTPVSGANRRLHDDYRVVDHLNLVKDNFKEMRELGFVGLAAVPNNGIFRGQAALYTTGKEDNLISGSVASVLGFDLIGFGNSSKAGYPMSGMGNVAAIRQHFLDARWQPTQSKVYEGSLDSVRAVQEGERLLIAEGKTYLSVLRLMRVLQEMQVPKSALVLSGQEWRNLDWLAAQRSAGQALIAPLKFPATPKLGEGQDADQLTLDLLTAWSAAPSNPAWLAQKGLTFSFTTHRLKDASDMADAVQDCLAAGLSEQKALAALTIEPARLLGVADRFGTLEPGKSASFVIRDGDPLSGTIEEVWVEGKRFPTAATVLGHESQGDKPEARPFIKPQTPPRSLYPAPFTPGSVLVKGATIWTQGPRGKIAQADLLVEGTKITQIGPNLNAPGAHIVQGAGYHLTPGLVDTHSHTAIDGAVNESSLNVTSMVRMKDVLDPFDHNLYLQLAAGLTTANILHGSANAIGGQAITCKWKLGKSPQEMIMAGAPEGIKFALGENPKQSNWATDQFRYPQSRMGVIESIRSAFVSAKNYRAQKLAQKNPRPDLALEALLEVLDGTRIIHCHSYRQDEILALIRLAEKEGFQVKVFQHVLEGYKVADELAAHGATASTFADWWAYKYEVDDAIPHNASLMTERGVVASVNSDSNDLARRLNTEAAKSMRYGGLNETQALDLVTRNPAQQMGILDRVGSLEPGKDGDFVLWSGHPLTQEAVCLETWIEGTRYFQRSAEGERVKRARQRRAQLLKLRQVKKEKSK